MSAPILVIGGGLGGLSAAIHLAAAGQKVTLLEKNDWIGGKMSEVRQDGFRWDCGPSVITMPHVLESLFSATGRRIQDYLSLQIVEPQTRYFFSDGTKLDASHNLAKMQAGIRKFHQGDAAGFKRFLDYAARLYRLTSPVFIYGDPPSMRSFTRVPPLDVLRIDGLRSMDRAIRGFVRSPQMRQLLGRFATYVGASPFRAPATLNVIAHIELTQGVWYPRGGIYSIARAYARLAEELGIDLRTGCEVEGIEVKSGKAIGVHLHTGEYLPARAIVANLDVSIVTERMLPASTAVLRERQRLLRAEPSCSGFIMLLGVRGRHEELAHHNLIFSSDYRAEFDQIFGQGRPAQEPSVYLSISARSTIQDAPVGCENWFVLVNAPALGPNWDWEANAQAYGELVLATLARRGFDVRDKIVTQQTLTPLDLERSSGARLGALYGVSSNSPWAAFRRPHNRAQGVKGLYFAGGSTHPGGGVPMVTLSGKLASRMILEDGH